MDVVTVLMVAFFIGLPIVIGCFLFWELHGFARDLDRYNRLKAEVHREQRKLDEMRRELHNR